MSPRVRVGLTSSPTQGGKTINIPGRREALMSDIFKVSERSWTGFKLRRELSNKILNHPTPFISVRVQIA